jgi:glucose/arabinose dehydrogenase
MTTTLRSLLRLSVVPLLALGAGAAQAQQALLPAIQHGSIAVQLDAIATGLGAPDYATYAPGDPTRLYVVEQGGLLRVIQNGTLLAAPALDISSRVAPPLVPSSANDERGFLGLAFHPDFNNPGTAGYRTLYTYNSEAIGSGATFPVPNVGGATNNYKNVVNEWKMDSNGVVDPNSRREVVSFGKAAGNHNGGTILFGTDRYMYLALGDGGLANDAGAGHLPGGNAQNLSTPLGKMLRFDPLNPTLTGASTNQISSNGQYRIPVNPSNVASQTPEIYAIGFRNPYRFALDRPDLGGTGNIIVADVGQNNVEEIDRLAAGGNFGWAVKEGDFLFNMSNGTVGARSPGSPAGLIDPISGPLGTLEYDHTQGISITGGFVYRGTDIPELYGKYIFGDLALRGSPTRADGRLFYADLVTGEIKEFLLPQFAGGQLPNGLTVHGFGEDASGEIYALVTNTPANGTGGIVYMLSAVPEPGTWLLLAAGLFGIAVRARRRA